MAPRAERLLIVGGGGHGKVVADMARACGHEVVGFADVDASKLGKVVEPGGARVLLTQAELLAATEDTLPFGATAIALAVGNNRARLVLSGSLDARSLPALVHPSAIVSPSAAIGAGTVVLPAAVVNAAARIGAAVIVNTAAVVEHDCVLGDGVHVSPGAVLAGGVTVGARGWIGAGATVIPGVRIGEDVVVGAGAVVTRDVPEGVTVVGVPARSTAGGK